MQTILRIPRAESALTPAQVAKAIVRQAPALNDGTPEMEPSAVNASEILDWAEYPDSKSLVVVLKDGTKLTGKLPAVERK